MHLRINRTKRGDKTYEYAQLVESIKHFVSKGAMDIEGLGEETVELLFHEGLLTNVGSAAVLKTIGFHDVVAVVVGIVLGSVWNFALSSKFVWGKY